MADMIQIRRDTAANWTAANPILAQGELGAETNTSKIKIGNGSSTWSALSYLIDAGDYLTASSTNTLTNKTIAFANNTLTGVQAALVSGTSIKTVNSTSLLGSGDVAVQPTLVSGTSIKTINSTSLLGSGDIAVGDVTLTGTQTLTNKTVTNIVFDGSTTEEVYVLAGTVIDPANGTIQTKTLSANTTFTESLVAGQSVTVMIDDGTAYTVTWPTTTWKTDNGSAPTLNTTGYTVVVLWKVNSTLYGARVGNA